MEKEIKQIGTTICWTCHTRFNKKMKISKFCSTSCSTKYYNKNQSSQDRRKYYIENKEKMRTQSLEYAKNNQVRSMFNSAKSRAKKRNLSFNLELSDIIIPTHCPILGIELKNNIGSGRQNNSPTLDRIIPEKGYIKENVWIISWKANRVKSDLSLNQLKDFCTIILEKIK